MDDQKSANYGFTKYSFHDCVELGDKAELLAILVAENREIIAIKDTSSRDFKLFMPRHKRYIEGSTPNANYLRRYLSGDANKADDKITVPPKVGEHLIISYLWRMREELTDLVVTEITPNFKPSINEVNGSIDKYKFCEKDYF
jgi:hypothetical protein